MVHHLSPEICYQGSVGSAQGVGCAVKNKSRFIAYIQDRVRERVEDADEQTSFASELRGMATTGMATEFVEKLLESVPEEKSWAIGEALAECILEDEDSREVCWPWNSVRDRRTPRASLPGADLMGFCKEGNEVFLLFGEVKTSSDLKAPPQVMNGSGGMAWQLEEEATRLDIQHSLLKWLRCRCNEPEHKDLYHEAVQRYVSSEGKEILLVGLLLRDTQPDELDLKSRAKHLSEKLKAPTRIELHAWYLPIPIRDWATLLDGGET
jgi:hypothetical protein